MNYFKHGYSFILISLWKIKFRSKIQTSIFGLYTRGLKIEIVKNGKIILGRNIKNRGVLNFISDAGKLQIGDNCFFNSNCSLTAMKEITIGNNCKFGNNVVIVDHDHNFKNICEDKYNVDKIFIGDSVWIGANVTILKGSIIGKNSVIAAGSVVKGHIEENTLYYNKISVCTKEIR